MQQRVVLQVYLETFCQKLPDGVQLDCTSQCINEQTVTMSELDLCLWHISTLLQLKHSWVTCCPVVLMVHNVVSKLMVFSWTVPADVSMIKLLPMPDLDLCVRHASSLLHLHTLLVLDR